LNYINRRTFLKIGIVIAILYSAYWISRSIVFIAFRNLINRHLGSLSISDRIVAQFSKDFCEDIVVRLRKNIISPYEAYQEAAYLVKPGNQELQEEIITKFLLSTDAIEIAERGSTIPVSYLTYYRPGECGSKFARFS